MLACRAAFVDAARADDELPPVRIELADDNVVLLGAAFFNVPGSAGCSSRVRSGASGHGTSSTVPAGTEHIFVGAGEAPSVILMVATRRLA